MIPEIQSKLEQADRVAHSPQLQNSESLSALFRFLVRRALENPHDPPREVEIATKVFGRTAEFDPRMDSTVRVQASRLRAKLADYYAGPGASDPIVIEVPRGGYLARFTERELPGDSTDPEPAESVPAPPFTRRRTPAVWFIAGLLCGALLGWTASAYSHTHAFVHLPWTASLIVDH